MSRHGARPIHDEESLGKIYDARLMRRLWRYVRPHRALLLLSLLLMLGVAAHFDDVSVTIRALLVVAFLFLTAPVAAHVLGRAAYITGCPLTPGSKPDDLAGRYDRATGRLAAPGRAERGEREAEAG